MRKYFLQLQAPALFLLAAFSLTGCIKDKCKQTYTVYTPVYESLTKLRGEVKSATALPLTDPGKLYVMGNKIYLNERNKGIHIIDNSNPLQPRNIAFINIPGNIDIAAKGNILYADMYTDLASIDVSNPSATTVRNFVTAAFPSAGLKTNDTYLNSISVVQPPADSIKIITGWAPHDTTMSCDAYAWLSRCNNCNVFFSASAASSASQSTSGGLAGSMARFAAVGNYLYALDRYSMGTFGMTDAASPQQIKRQYLNGQGETIFPFNNNLFVGTPTGMGIYSIQDPANPVFQSMAAHFQSCDPVITDGKYAYVTLYDASVCRGQLNQMEVYDVTDVTRPKQVKVYPMTNPHGLSKDGNLLFVCDGRDGLKVYDATDPADLKLVSQVKGLNTYDIITDAGRIYLVAKDGLYQYDYSN
ncbi:MAG: hypothetical protein JST39_13750, partial [Bacteroidetes bacterium]|nr:hypothetical protein [Bacteroidota bacterium]